MKIVGFLWLPEIIEKLAVKHSVAEHEVEQVFANGAKIRFMEKGDRLGEDLYLALGQSDAGRYLAVLFIYKHTQQAMIVSARDMASKERKTYGRK
ncbi:MAG TPA: BrnT family toxin [Anaerolineales bacterium]|jgi:hypothetical protein|nr:BrnT family toxin [Anaerolineales bacterium]